MFFPPLGVNEMICPVTPVETFPYERAKHAVLLVDAVEERANVTLLAEGSPGKLRGVLGALHILTSTQKAQRRTPFQPGEPVSRRSVRSRT